MTRPQKHSALPYKKHSTHWKRKREAYLYSISRTLMLTYEYLEDTSDKVLKKVLRNLGFHMCKNIAVAKDFAMQAVVLQQGPRVRQLKMYFNPKDWKGIQGVIV